MLKCALTVVEVGVSENLTKSPLWINLHVVLMTPPYTSTHAVNGTSEHSSVKLELA